MGLPPALPIASVVRSRDFKEEVTVLSLVLAGSTCSNSEEEAVTVTDNEKEPEYVEYQTDECRVIQGFHLAPPSLGSGFSRTVSRDPEPSAG